MWPNNINSLVIDYHYWVQQEEHRQNGKIYFNLAKTSIWRHCAIHSNHAFEQVQHLVEVILVQERLSLISTPQWSCFGASMMCMARWGGLHTLLPFPPLAEWILGASDKNRIYYDVNASAHKQEDYIATCLALSFTAWMLCYNNYDSYT